MKKILSFILSLVMVFSIFGTMSVSASAATFEDQLIEAGFPLDYIDDLVALHKLYPNWVFKPFDTDLNFNDAVKGEMKNTPTTEANIKKYLDPRNWLDEKHIFQYESIKREDSAQTIAGVEGILSGTWMANSLISYKDAYGATKKYNNTTKYSNAMMEASKNSGLSVNYIAAKIRQENGGTKNTANAVSGVKAPFLGIYNYYNIGANSGASDGLHWADGKMWAVRDTYLYSDYDATKKAVSGTKTKIAIHSYMCFMEEIDNDYLKVKSYSKLGNNSYSTDGKVGYVLKADTDYASLSYGRPWTNPYKSIYNGAKWIADGYLKYQYTIFLQKYNVNKASGNLYNHEYMANYSGAVSESEHLYSGYKRAGTMAEKRTFYIPVFKGMGITVKKPTGLTQSTNSATTVTLNWDKQTVATGYIIYRYIASTNKYIELARVEDNDTTKYKVLGLNAGTIYNFAVAAYVQQDGKTYIGAKSDCARCFTRPAKVGLTAMTALSNHQIKLTWKKVNGYAQGYQIQWAKDSAFKSIIAKTTVAGQSKLTYTGKNFTKGRTYYARVRAYRAVDGVTYYGAWSVVKQVKSK